MRRRHSFAFKKVIVIIIVIICTVFTAVNVNIRTLSALTLSPCSVWPAWIADQVSVVHTQCILCSLYACRDGDDVEIRDNASIWHSSSVIPSTNETVTTWNCQCTVNYIKLTTCMLNYLFFHNLLQSLCIALLVLFITVTGPKDEAAQSICKYLLFINTFSSIHWILPTQITFFLFCIQL